MSGQPEWILVRHGETEWTEKKLLHGGRFDSPLSAKGKHQARLTAEKLAGEKISSIYSSPQGRASQTARIIAEPHSLAPELIDDFREYDFGWLEGKPLFDFSENGHTPKILHPVIRLIMRLTGERTHSFYSRIEEDVRTLLQKDHDHSIVIVTHWGVLSVIAPLLLGEDLDDWRENSAWAPCGITRLRPVNGRWEFVERNNTDHLMNIGQGNDTI